MKLDIPQVLEGHFWLPELADKVSGRLQISEIGKCSLELLGVFGGHKAAFRDTHHDLSTIHGVVQGGPVTLYDCFYLNRNFGFGTVAVSKVHVGTVFRGANLPPEDQLRVTELEAAITGLDEWLQITGIESGFEFDSARKVQAAFIRYVPPPKIELSLPGLQATFKFAWTAPGGRARTEAKITHQARLSVVPTDGASFESVRQQLTRLVNFLSFAADQTLTIDSLYAYSPSAAMDVAEGQKLIQLPVFYESSTRTRAAKVERNTMLFAYPDVTDRLEGMLKSWMAHHEALSPAFNLYFAVQAGRHAYVESEFLSIVQGLETLHDRTSDEAVEPADVFGAKVTRILATCPEADREWLAEQLAYANKPSLRTRLRRMLKPFASTFGNAEARKVLVENIVDTRNYLTHYDPGLAARATRGSELLPLTSKLQALFQLHLLLLLEIDQGHIDKLIASNRQLRYRMGLDRD